MSTIRVGNIGPLTGNTSVIADPGVSGGGMSLVSMGSYSLSGTSTTITGIPSWARRITVVFNNVSSTSSANWKLQIGSGSITSSGYTSGYSYQTGTTTSTSTSSVGFEYPVPSSSATGYGTARIHLCSGYTYICDSVIFMQSSTYMGYVAGTVTLSGAMDRINLTADGSATFDAGTLNVFYE